MNADKIKNRIGECVTLFGFEYDGKDGNVDPYYIPESKDYEYLLYYDGVEQTVYDLDAVMNTPFIAGHSLSEVSEKLIITEF